MTKWNLAIVGSRDFYDYGLLKEILAEWVEKWGTPSGVVSGDAQGADALAVRWAKEFRIEIIVHEAYWNMYGKRAGFLRNHLIVGDATHMVAFPSQFGTGTQHAIKVAGVKKIPVVEHFID